MESEQKYENSNDERTECDTETDKQDSTSEQNLNETDFHLRVSSFSCLEQDIELAAAVAKHPSLYDRRHPKYRRINDPMNEAWEDVAKSVRHVNNGDMACRLFEVLKKRYSKKKMNFKRAKHYSNSSELINKAKYELEKYQFLSWLEPFIRYRTVKLDNGATELDEIEDVTDENVIENHSKSSKSVKRKYVDDINFSAERPAVNPKTMHYDAMQMPSVAVPKHPAHSTMQVNLASPTSSTFVNHQFDQGSMVYQNKVLQDEDDLFAAMIVTQLKSLNKREKCLAKHEISNVLFKAQLSQMDDK